MSQKFEVFKKKGLKQMMQQYYDLYIVATGMYNLVLYEHHFEMLERALTYHMDIMNRLNETFKLLEPLEESIDMIGLEKCIFKTRTERLALDNYYALQEMRDLYKEVEQQFYTLKTASMLGDDSNDTD